MNDNEVLLKLHENGSAYFSLPDFETFKADMQDDTKLSAFIKSMSKHYEIGDIDTVKADILAADQATERVVKKADDFLKSLDFKAEALGEEPEIPKDVFVFGKDSKKKEEKVEKEEIHSWLDVETDKGYEEDRSFFSTLEESEVVPALQEAYPGFKIESSWSWDVKEVLPSMNVSAGEILAGPLNLFTGNTIPGVNKHAVKITNPKTGESITLPLNTKGNWFEESQTAASKAELTSFIDENINVLNFNEYKLNKDKRLDEAIKRQNVSIDQGGYGLSTEQERNINEEVDNVDFNDPAPETRTSMTRVAGDPLSIPGQTTYTYTPENPHKDLLSQAENILLSNNQNVKDYKPSTEQVQSLAREIMRGEKQRETVISNTEQWLEDNPGKQGITLLGNIELGKELKNKFEAEEVVYEDMSNTWTNKILNSTEASIVANFQEIANSTEGKFDIKDGEEIVVLKNGKQVSKTQHEAYLKASSYLIDKATQLESQFNKVNDFAEKVDDIELSKDLLRRDYNLFRKSGFTITSGFAEMFVNNLYYAKSYAKNMGALGFIADVLPMPSALPKVGAIIQAAETVMPEKMKALDKSIDDVFFSYKDWSGKQRESYARDVSFERALNLGNKGMNWEDFGIFALQEVSTQIPILTTLAASGGAGTVVIGGSSAGGYILESEYQEDLTGIKRKSAVFKDKDRSDAETFLIGTGFGIAEGGAEYLTTLPILKRGWGIMGRQGKQELVRTTLKRYLKKETAKSLLYDPASESISEGLTQVVQNALDSKPIFEGVDHAMFSGGLMGATMSYTPYFTGVITSGYYNKSNKLGLQTQDLMGQVEKLNQSIEKGNNSSNTKAWKKYNGERLSKQIEVVNSQIKSNINKLTGNVFTNINDKNAEEFINTQIELEEVRKQASDIVSDVEAGRMTKEDAKIQLAPLKRVNDVMVQNLNDFRDLKSYGDSFTLLSEEDKGKYNSQAVQDIINEKAREGITLTEKDISNEDIKIKANKLYVTEIIDESAKRDKSLLNALNIDMVTFETNAQAAKWYEKKYKNTPNFSEQTLEDIKSGKINGANMDGGKRNEKGKGEIIFIKEAAVNNYKTNTRSHEIAHTVLYDILGDANSNPDEFKQIANQLALYLQQTNPTAFKNMFGAGLIENLVEGSESESDVFIEVEGKKFLAEEVITNFIELVGKNRIVIDEQGKPKFSGLLGVMLNGLYKSKSKKGIDFKGDMDIINFIKGLGEKISNGTLTTENIRDYKKSIETKKVEDKPEDKKPETKKPETKKPKGEKLTALEKMEAATKAAEEGDVIVEEDKVEDIKVTRTTIKDGINKGRTIKVVGKAGSYKLRRVDGKTIEVLGEFKTLDAAKSRVAELVGVEAPVKKPS
jgi:hypothetical protein